MAGPAQPGGDRGWAAARAWLTRLLPNPATLRITAIARNADGSEAGRAVVSGTALGLDGPGWLRVASDTGELAEHASRSRPARCSIRRRPPRS